MADSWEALYRGDAQSLWGLVTVPLLYLVRLLLVPPRGPGVEPGAARFVRAWALVFLIETILDPVATGPLVRWLGLGGALADNAMLPFVLLGDLRVFLLVLRVAEPGRSLAAVLAEAVLWTLVVPVMAGGLWVGLRSMAGPLPGQGLWLVYEIAFAVLATTLRARLVPLRTAAPAPRRYLRAVLAYVTLYYALWAVADVLILAGHDVGWALRILPNQLYYALWVPFAVESFFAASNAATNSATQVSR